MDYKISIVLDKRRALQNGKYPVKVRLWIRDQKFAKRFSVKGLYMTEKEYESGWGSASRVDKLSKTERENYLKIKAIYDRAIEAAESMDYFDVKLFQDKLFRKASDKTSVVYHFNKAIRDFEKKGRIGAASSYNCALTSLLKYNATRKTRKDALSFMEITPEWLESYESWMIDNHGRSVTTVAIYVRSLRAIFNNAQRANDLDDKYYPFGKGKYEIPEEVKVKKTLNRKQVAQLHNALLPQLQDRARDYWLFSYACNGMNFKDIALLKYENIKEGEISYYREKTRRKKRKQKKIIRIALNALSHRIIEKYKTEYRGEKSYVFPILEDNDGPREIHRKVLNFVRATNQQLKHIAKEYEFPSGFSTYWARHSYATNMIEIGASIEFVSEALNHSDIKVTQNYFDGFEKKTKKRLTEKLMDF